MNRVLMIAVPQPGRREDGGAIRIAVAVQPMLDGPTLGDTPLVSWPLAALSAGPVRIEVASAPDAEVLSIAAAVHLSADPALWSRLFPTTLAVHAQDGAVDERPVIVQPVADGVARVATAYEALAAGQEDAPAVAAAALEGDPAAVADAPDPLLVDAPAQPPEPPEFHRSVALLREHPVLMRALGLVFDVTAAAADTAAMPAEGVVRVTWPGGAIDGLALASPWTRYRRQGLRFLPRGAGDLDDGMLALNSDRWAVTTLDTDVALAVLRDTRASAPGTMPALRSGGLTLIDRERSARGAARRMRNDAHAARDPAEMVLELDDLALGYRIDARRGDGLFQPLCARLASYSIDGRPVGPSDAFEEGNLKASAAFDYGDGTLRSDEQFARWQGWSLAVNNPLVPTAETANATSPLSWQFRVPPGSLPKLRFSQKYHLRARVADITGGGLPADAPVDDDGVIGPIFYRRYEPITAPQVTESHVPLQPAPGETIATVVIRSDRGVDPEAFAQANPHYPCQPHRRLLPGLVPLSLVEQHDMFDRDRTPDDVNAIIDAHSTANGAPGDALFPDPAAGGVAVRLVERGQAGASTTRGWGSWPDSGTKPVELRALPPGTPPTVGWESERDGDVFAVSLPPGRAATLLISATMEGDCADHFVASSDRPETRDAAVVGTHPLLTPATTLTLTHAVRMPLADPAGKIAPHRTPGSTTALLIPSPPDLALDAPSTAAVQLSASWTEVDDIRREKRTGIAVGRTALSPDTGAWTSTIVQEFGDTRHRRVAYRVTAESRHRHFFAEDEDDALFRVTGDLGEVDVPSTARPPRPDVIEVIPAFRWRDAAGSDARTIADRTREGLLRVVLRAPWHRSGDGEELAVLVATGEPADPDHVALVTQASRDAVYPGATPRPWFLDEGFPLATVTGDLPPSDLGLPIALAPHRVRHDGTDWTCDIAFDPTGDLPGCYMPLIRLAVARYQRHSLAGLSHSPVVLLPPAPVYPERRLIVTRNGRYATVQLRGIGSGGTPNRVAVRVEACDSNFADTADVAADINTTALWHVIANRAAEGSLGSDITLELPKATSRLRLVITEHEVLPSGDGGQVPPGMMPAGRMVFSDIVLLP